MFKKFMSAIEGTFGRQGWERLVEKTDNKKIIKLLSIIAFIRFFTFPISFTIFVTGFSIELTIKFLYLLSSILMILFELFNDSIWINFSWFNLTTEEVDNEIKNLDLSRKTKSTKDA